MSSLREAAKGVVTTGGGVYNIGFNDGDETQFDAYNLKELEELWKDFCKENGFKENSVDYVCRTMVSRTSGSEKLSGWSSRSDAD